MNKSYSNGHLFKESQSHNQSYNQSYNHNHNVSQNTEILKEVRMNHIKSHKDDKENKQPKKKKIDSQIVELKDEYMNLITK